MATDDISAIEQDIVNPRRWRWFTHVKELGGKKASRLVVRIAELAQNLSPDARNRLRAALRKSEGILQKKKEPVAARLAEGMANALNRNKLNRRQFLTVTGLATGGLLVGCGTDVKRPALKHTKQLAGIRNDDIALRLDAILPKLEEALKGYVGGTVYTDRLRITTLPHGDFYDVALIGSLHRRGFTVDERWLSYHLGKLLLPQLVAGLYDHTNDTIYLPEPDTPYEDPKWYDFRPQVFIDDAQRHLRTVNILTDAPNDDTLACTIGHEWFHHWQANAHPELFTKMDELLKQGWGATLSDEGEPTPEQRTARQALLEHMHLIEGHAHKAEHEVIAPLFPNRQSPGLLITATALAVLLLSPEMRQKARQYIDGSSDLAGKSFSEINKRYAVK